MSGVVLFLVGIGPSLSPFGCSDGSRVGGRACTVGLVDTPHQTQMLSLCSHLSHQAVAAAAAAEIRKFLSVFELASTAAHIFVAMAALGEAQLVEAASAGFALSVCPALF